MSVYVDDAFLPYRGMLMSHLTADTDEELHAFAERLGLRREWFQRGRQPWRHHYDVSKSKREEAIRLGAITETWEEGAVRRALCAVAEGAVEGADAGVTRPRRRVSQRFSKG